VLLFVVGLGLALGAAPANAQEAPRPELDAEELEFLDLINEHRQQSGLNELVATVTLNTASDRHSWDMASNDWFDHTGSDGSDPSERCQWAGYPEGCAENIAAGYPTARDVFDGWRSSSGHNANMLGDYAAIGIALEEGGGYGSYWTTDFGWVVDEPYDPGADDPGPGPDPGPDPDPDPGPDPDPDPSPDPDPGPDPAPDPDPGPGVGDGAGFGSFCLDGDQCFSRACVVVDATEGYCTRTCDVDPCPYGYACDAGASGAFCFFAGGEGPPPSQPAGMPPSTVVTCRATPSQGTGEGGWAWLTVALAGLVMARRRAPRAGRTASSRSRT
jgi:hypothetical protein